MQGHEIFGFILTPAAAAGLQKLVKDGGGDILPLASGLTKLRLGRDGVLHQTPPGDVNHKNIFGGGTSNAIHYSDHVFSKLNSQPFCLLLLTLKWQTFFKTLQLQFSINGPFVLL